MTVNSSILLHPTNCVAVSVIGFVVIIIIIIGSIAKKCYRGIKNLYLLECNRQQLKWYDAINITVNNWQSVTQ